jgi:hypothetical protein
LQRTALVLRTRHGTHTMTVMFRFQSIILLWMDGIVAGRLFLMVDAVPSMQFCMKTLVSADSNRDGRLSRREYGDALRTLRRDDVADVFDDASDDGVSQRLQLVFDDLRGPDDSIDVLGTISLNWTCQAIIEALDKRTASARTSNSVVTLQDGEREISLEYCFAAMTITDGSNDGDGYLDSTEYLRFVKLLSSEDLNCSTKFEDLPQQLQDSFEVRSSNELVSIAGANPADIVSDEQGQFLTNLCIETISLVGEARGHCSVPTLAPNAELRPVASSTLECFYSYAQANENDDAWLSRREYIIFVYKLSGDDPAFANLNFDELPSVLQNNFNDLAVDDAEIDISGSQAGSTPTREELEYLARVCNETNAAIQLASSPGSAMPRPASTTLPTKATSTPSIQPATESPTSVSLPTESPSSSTGGPAEQTDFESLEPTEAPSDTSRRPTTTPSILSFEPSGSPQAPPTSAQNIISLEPSESSQAPSNASPRPTISPSIISLKPSLLSATPSYSSSVPSASPTESAGGFEVRSIFIISNTEGISASDLSPVAEERLQLDASYIRLVQLVTDEEFGTAGLRRHARRLKRRLLVQYIAQSARTVNLTDSTCPLASANNTLCQTVEAVFNINATSDENLATVLAETKAAVDAGILEGQLQSLLDELNAPLRVVVLSTPSQTSSAPASSPSLTSTATPASMQNSGNETEFTISTSFIISNRIGISAVGFSEESKGYADINTAFGNLCSYVVQVNGTGAQYVNNSNRIVDVSDLKCPASPAGFFCQSVFVTCQVKIVATNPEEVVSSITSAVEHEIEVGSLQNQLDFINPWSSYSIEEGYVPTRPAPTPTASPMNETSQRESPAADGSGNNSTNMTSNVAIGVGVAAGVCILLTFCYLARPSEQARASKSFASSIYVDEFGTTAALRGNNPVDTLDDDDGYYEEEYRYAPVKTRIPVSPSKFEDNRFAQVFGAPKVSPVQQRGGSTSTPPTTASYSSAHTSHGSEQAPRRVANSSSDSNTSASPASMRRVPMASLRAPIAEGEEDSESDDSSSGSSSSSDGSDDDDSDSSDSGSEDSNGSSSSSDDDNSDSGSDSD